VESWRAYCPEEIQMGWDEQPKSASRENISKKIRGCRQRLPVTEQTHRKRGTRTIVEKKALRIRSGKNRPGLGNARERTKGGGEVGPILQSTKRSELGTGKAKRGSTTAPQIAKPHRWARKTFRGVKERTGVLSERLM